MLRAALPQARERGLVGRDAVRIGLQARDRAAPRRRRLHLRRGDGAAVVAERLARPADGQAAVPGRLRRVPEADAAEQRGDARHRPHILRLGAEKYAELGTEQSKGTRLLSLWDTSEPGQLRAARSTPPSAPDRGLRRRRAGGRELKAIIPGRLLGAVPRPRGPRVGLAIEALAAAGTMAGSRRRDGDRRGHLHGQLALRTAEFYATSRAASARRAARARAGP